MRPPQHLELGGGLYQDILKKQSQCTVLYRVSENVYLSTVSELTLEQYIHAHREHCLNNRKQLCVNCTGVLQVTKTVLNHGYCT